MDFKTQVTGASGLAGVGAEALRAGDRAKIEASCGVVEVGVKLFGESGEFVRDLR